MVRPGLVGPEFCWPSLWYEFRSGLEPCLVRFETVEFFYFLKSKPDSGPGSIKKKFIRSRFFIILEIRTKIRTSLHNPPGVKNWEITGTNSADDSAFHVRLILPQGSIDQNWTILVDKTESPNRNRTSSRDQIKDWTSTNKISNSWTNSRRPVPEAGGTWIFVLPLNW